MKSGIEWTDRTWNPTRGCSRVSEGCRNCYAERVATRFSGPGQPYEGLVTLPDGGRHGQSGHARTGIRGRWNGVVRLVPEKLAEPLSWRKPQRVFVNSMSDLFHESLGEEQIDAVFGVMSACPHITFQVLTKRARRMASEVAWPIPNVWLGVSVEDQRTADERIPLLMQTPASVRFVSYEPALEAVDFRARCEACSGLGTMYGPSWSHVDSWPCGSCKGSGRAGSMVALDWLIVGGESGPGARPCDVAWIRGAVQQCQAAGVPVFVKQIGSRPFAELARPGCSWCLERDALTCFYCAGGRIKSPKGGDPFEWPQDIRVREFPRLPAKAVEAMP